MLKKLMAVAVGVSLFAAPAFAAGRIDKRECNQQERIEQGMQNGRLSRREAARLERKQEKLRQREMALRGRQGGRLTVAQRERFERRQNNFSRQIAHEKHDGNRR
ncbi:MAG: hypothetical protein ACJ790_22985 [Myxococcaceae bacterium]